MENQNFAGNPGESLREYYFHWTGKMNQSYVLETTAREPVYEAICDHIGVFTPYRYTFVNRRTGVSKECRVTHTLTASRGNGEERGGFSVITYSGFKIDGVKCWDYLDSLGCSVRPRQSGIRLNFDVLRRGTPVAYLEAAGTNILRDDKKSRLGDKLPGKGLYKVSCKDEDIEAVFMACFCLSRVEFN